MTDLVEKVARAIVKYDGGDWERDPLDQNRFAVGQATEALKAIEGSGWQLVPVEPTQEQSLILDRGGAWISDVYRDLLAAAPDPLGDSHD